MRVERNTNQHSFNCWLSPSEYDELRRSTESYCDELVIRFGGEVGLRSFEIPQIKPKHVRREPVEDKDFYFVRVPQGKDTTGSGGKPRDAYSRAPSNAISIAISVPRTSLTMTP